MEIRQVDTTLDNKVVYKSNTLNRAAFQMSSLEYRLLLLLISHVEKSEKPMKYRFATQEIVDYFKLGKSNNCYSVIRDTVEQLHTKTLEIEEGSRFIKHNWLITSIYHRDLGYFDLELNPNLREHFINMNGDFLKYYLRNILKMSNVHAIRLYELLAQEDTDGEPFCISIPELKRFLGVPVDMYPQTSDFKVRVLNTACELINTQADITVQYIDVKEGRRITGFGFTVQRNEQQTIEPSNKHLYSLDTIELLGKIGITPSGTQKVVAQYGETLVVQEAQRFLASGKEVKDPPRSFRRQLKLADVQTALDRVEQATLKALETADDVVEGEPTQPPVPEAVKVEEPTQPPVTEMVKVEEPTQPPVTEIVVEHPTTFVAEENYPPQANEPTKQDKVVTITPAELQANPAYQALVDYGCRRTQARDFVMQYPVDYLLYSVNYVNGVLLRKDIAAPVPYLETVIRSGYEGYKEEMELEELARASVSTPPTPQASVVSNPVATATTSATLPIYTAYTAYTEVQQDLIETYMRYTVEQGFVRTDNQRKELHTKYQPLIDQAFVNGVTMDFLKSNCPLFVEIVGITGFQEIS